MGMEAIGYEGARTRVRPGDVVAFGGKGLLSRIVKAAGKTAVSHSGVIVAPLDGDREPRFLESTVRLKGGDPVWGVKTTSFEERWCGYRGDVWLLPLRQTVRDHQFDEEKFRAFAAKAEGATFDIKEGLRIIIKELLEELDRATLLAEEYYFCAEVVADAFLAAGTIRDVDPPDVSPKDLCRWRMYADTYYSRRLEGRPQTRSIRDFNTLPPGTTD